MWTNTLKKKLKGGETCFLAILTEFPLPDIAEYMGLLGFDALLIDGEHGGVSPATARDACRAAVAGGTTPLVRTPYNDPRLIMAYLDAGAHGIVVPHSNTAADVRATVRACRYPPAGERGAASTSRGVSFGVGPAPGEAFQRANEEVLVAALLEEKQALDNLDEILEVEGVDVYFIGTGDLALSMGLPIGSAEVRAVANDAIRKVKAAGKVAATPAASAAQARDLAAIGTQLISTNPFVVMRQSVQSWLRDARG